MAIEYRAGSGLSFRFVRPCSERRSSELLSSYAASCRPAFGSSYLAGMYFWICC
jgi:hypothetical protein